MTIIASKRQQVKHKRYTDTRDEISENHRYFPVATGDISNILENFFGASNNDSNNHNNKRYTHNNKVPERMVAKR